MTPWLLLQPAWSKAMRKKRGVAQAIPPGGADLNLLLQQHGDCMRLKHIHWAVLAQGQPSDTSAVSLVVTGPV